MRVELGGEVLAESSAPYLLFEPPLPVRSYLPAADVRTDLLAPSDTRTFCAYKGEASYWSVAGGAGRRVELRGAAARGRRDHRPDRLLRRTRRPRDRRGAAGPSDHALVAALAALARDRLVHRHEPRPGAGLGARRRASVRGRAVDVLGERWPSPC